MAVWLVIALGGAAGAVARYWLSVNVGRRLPPVFPFGTLSVNIFGAFLVGILAGILAAGKLNPGAGDLAWSGLGVGFCGSFTTMSSWSLDSLRLGLDRRFGLVLANFAVTVTGCLLSVIGGYTVGGWLAG